VQSPELLLVPGTYNTAASIRVNNVQSKHRTPLRYVLQLHILCDKGAEYADLYLKVCWPICASKLYFDSQIPGLIGTEEQEIIR
jgi:hypothetical protein